MGLIREIGTSIYTKSELQYTLESDMYDWVQIPVNILDSSFYNMVLEYDKKIKVSARSVFLQGILLTAPNDLPQKFNKWETLWKKKQI